MARATPVTGERHDGADASGKSSAMVKLFEHLREKHPGLATYIFGSSVFVIVVSLILLIYFLRQDRAKKQQRREERIETRRQQRRRGRQKR